MKNFLLSLPKKFRRADKTLEIKTFLCSSSWDVFTMDGSKMLLVFQESGILLFVQNGVVKEGSWKYLAINDTFIINDGKTNIMYHLCSVVNDIFALVQDGTDECVLITSPKNEFLPNRKIEDLLEFFSAQERALMEAKEKEITAEQKYIQDAWREYNEKYKV